MAARLSDGLRLLLAVRVAARAVNFRRCASRRFCEGEFKSRRTGLPVVFRRVLRSAGEREKGKRLAALPRMKT